MMTAHDVPELLWRSHDLTLPTQGPAGPELGRDGDPAPARAAGRRVRLRGAVRRFGDRTVLDRIDLDVAPGEFLAIVGRSGCGKSTLLRLLAGLDTADGGQVAVDDRLPVASSPDTRLMFQDARLLPWKHVADNVGLGLTSPDAPSRARGALAAVALPDRAHDWPATLSGGQRQRVALARALVHEPRLLLLDEPLGALDALTRLEMQALLEDLWLAQGFTAVLVTHDVTEAVRLADRVVVMAGGRIAHEEPIDLPRPRRQGEAVFAHHERRLLEAVLRPGGTPQAIA